MIAYEMSNPTSPTLCSDISQTATCNDGSFYPTLTYTEQSCTQEYRSCTTSWSSTVDHGDPVQAYESSSKTSPDRCDATVEVATCNDGNFEPTLSYTNQSCTQLYRDCDLPWGGSISDAESVTAYEEESPSTSCNSETRSCNDSTLSGRFTFETCTVVVPTCVVENFVGQKINSNSGITWNTAGPGPVAFTYNGNKFVGSQSIAAGSEVDCTTTLTLSQ